MTMAMMMSSVLGGNSREDAPGLFSYQPRINPDMGPNAYLGLGSIGSSFGPMGQALGQYGAIMGYGFAPQLMQRLMSNRNANALDMEQQQLMHHAMMSSAFMSGDRIAESLGMPGMGKAIDAMMPMMMGIPGMSDILSAFSPNAMTFAGGQAMAQQARMLDPMTRLHRSTIDAMERARQQMTDPGHTGFRDAVAMSGFNQDEFQEIGVFAADQGFGAADMDREAVRRDERRQAVERHFKGRAYESLNAESKKMVDEEAEIGLQARAQEERTKLAGGVVRTTMNAFGVDRDTAMAVGQAMGFRAGNKQEANQLEDSIRQIKALGEAAGMSGKQLIDTAKALQSQYGGSFSYQMQVGAFSNMIQELSNFNGRQQGGEFHQNDEDRNKSNQLLQNFQNSRVSDYMRVVQLHGTDAQRQEMASVLQSGDQTAAYNWAIKGLSDTKSPLANAMLDDEQRKAADEQLTNKIGPYALMRARLSAVREDMKRAAGDVLKDFWNRPDAQRFAIEQQAYGQITPEEAAKSGVSVAEVQKFATLAVPGGAIDAAMSADKALIEFNQRRDMFDKSPADQKAALDRSLARQQLHQTLIPSLVRGKVKSISDALQSLGIMASEDEAKAAFSDEERTGFIEASQKRQDALDDLKGAKDDDQKAAAKKKYDEAMKAIGDMGIDEQDAEGHKAMGESVPVSTKADVPGDKTDGSQAAPNATGSPKTSAGEAPAAPQTLDASMALTVNVRVNDEDIPKTAYTAQVNQNSGFRRVTLDGIAPVSGTPS
jgi:hypothetical protein